MTDAGWAEKLVEPYQCGVCRGQVHEEACAVLLRKEHARSVRIVKVHDKAVVDGGYSKMSYDFQAGYHQACNDILAALTKGRGKGRKCSPNNCLNRERGRGGKG